MGILSDKLRGGLSALRYLPRALTLTWEAARGWTLVWLALLLLQGVLPAATVQLTRAVVDSLVSARRAGAAGGFAAFEPLLWLIVLYAALILVGEGLRSATGWVRVAQGERVRDHIQNAIHVQAVAADLAFFERPEFHDRLYRATWESSERSVALLETLGGLLQTGVTLIAMMAVILPFGAWLPLVLLLSTLPAFLVVARYAVRLHLWWRSITEEERRIRYHDWILTSSEAAAEIRLFELGDRFRGVYQALRRKHREGRIRLERGHALVDFSASLGALALAGCAVAWVAWRAAAGAITLGQLALFFHAFRQGQGVLRTMTENVGGLYRNSLFLSNLFEYLSFEPQIRAPATPSVVPEPLRDGLRLQGVKFTYPGASRAALDGLDLLVPAGKMAAIVGPNGAGKSTLIKLVCRLYDPDQGSITLDGLDLRQLDLGALRRTVTVLVQEPLQYHGTVWENIGLADATAPGPEALRAAAEAAGAAEVIARLPAAGETQLGKLFGGGVELSSGEWRRMALARAFLRRSPVLILDEPTSDMDPWAEADWLDRFVRLASGRTVIVVTHRLSTASRADSIHVLIDGRVVESGTHAELVRLGGRYAAAWDATRRGELLQTPDAP
jgi:ATP-binding cassette, subfamily B, bacterial